MSKFRVMSYIDVNEAKKEGSLNKDDFDIITDVVVFGCAHFTEFGIVVCDDEAMNYALDNLYKTIGDRQVNVYIKISGPDTQPDSEDIEEQRKEMASRYSNSFKTDTLVGWVESFVTKNGFDGVFFDYEYPVSSSEWRDYSKFLVSVDKALGEDKKLGVAVLPENIKLSGKAISAIDIFEMKTKENYESDEALLQNYTDAGIEKSKLDFCPAAETAGEKTKFSIEHGVGGVSLSYNKEAFAADGSALKTVNDTAEAYK